MDVITTQEHPTTTDQNLDSRLKDWVVPTDPNQPGTESTLKEWVVRETPEMREAYGYPVWASRDNMRQIFKADEPIRMILTGETGSGKTTLFGPILQVDMGPTDKMIISQPRRISARENAERVAELMGVQVGHEVGYQYRGESKISENTRILFTVNGSLLRRLQENPLLPDYTIVAVDEIHERTVDGDVVLGLLKRAQKLRVEAGMPPLKLAVMSATVDLEKLQKYFDTDDLIQAPGEKRFPVTEHYEKKGPSGEDPILKAEMPNKAAQKAADYIKRLPDGNVLIFMPGRGEIEETIAEIEKLGLGDNIELLPLYGELPKGRQRLIYDETPGKRKIIVATNMAETGLTLPNIGCVVDSGLIRQKIVDPASGAERLDTIKHAKSGIKQRLGRAGRKIPGEYHALFAQDDPERPDFQEPELKRSDLAHVVLLLKKSGVENVKEFDFMDKPDPMQLEFAVKTLQSLGALDANEKLTKIGELMADLPIEPHAARMIVAAVENNDGIEEACTLASFLENGNVFMRSKEWSDAKQAEAKAFRDAYGTSGSDFTAMLEVWEQYGKSKDDKNWRDNPKTAYLNRNTLREVDKVRTQLLEILQTSNIEIKRATSPKAIEKNLVTGYVDKLLKYNYRLKKDHKLDTYELLQYAGKNILIQLDPGSATGNEFPPIIITPLIIRKVSKKGREGLFTGPVHPVSSLATIAAVAPQLVQTTSEKPAYNPDSDSVVAKNTYRLDTLVEDELVSVPPDVASAQFMHALAGGNVDLPVVKANRKLFDKGQVTFEELQNFYQQRLGQIKSRKELEALLSHGADITYHPSAAGQKEVEKSVPKTGETATITSDKKLETPIKEGVLDRVRNVITTPYRALKRFVARAKAYLRRGDKEEN